MSSLGLLRCYVVITDMAYTPQDWRDQGDPAQTPIWAKNIDTSGPTMQRLEEGVRDAHINAAAAQTTANAAIPKPATVSANQVIVWNGTTYIASKVNSGHIDAGGINPDRIAGGSDGQVLQTSGVTPVWATRQLGVPLRAIMAFHMDSGTEPLPVGFEICDGRTVAVHDLGGGPYVMPDFRNRFLLGADTTKAIANAGGTSNAVSDAPGPKGVGGTHAHLITVGELPSHSHTASETASGTHVHTQILRSLPSSVVLSGGSVFTAWIPDGNNITVNTGAAGDHTHTITIGSTGSGTAIDTRPRFVGVVYIMKVRNT